MNNYVPIDSADVRVETHELVEMPAVIRAALRPLEGHDDGQPLRLGVRFVSRRVVRHSYQVIPDVLVVKIFWVAKETIIDHCFVPREHWHWLSLMARREQGTV